MFSARWTKQRSSRRTAVPGATSSRQPCGLTPEMAPGVDAILEDTKSALGLDADIESYVYPSPTFNAAAARPEGGRLFVLYSSSSP